MKAALPPEVGEFLGDFTAQDVVMKNLERAVQVCVDVANHLVSDRKLPPPPSMGAAFVALVREGIVTPDLGERLRKTVGLRNLAVHEYEAIDYTLVHGLIQTDLVVFEDFARAILARL
ncbi:MAG: DUF86 domain-containing protein [Spirochaetales bacterium]